MQCTPELNSAGAASFARHTGLIRGCVRQSGGAGSGGKPDKSGGKLRVFARNYRCAVGTNGKVPLFVPRSRLIVPFLIGFDTQ